jgi:F-type H+-transporting ATPase subunit b
MQAETAATTGTVQQTSGGFPPFKTESFPSQFFWLVITFAFLFVVVWRIAGPRIGAAIEARKAKIDGDIAAAAKHKTEAEAALAAYHSALAEAKNRAHVLAEENRKTMDAEAEKAKAEAESQAQTATSAAESRIGAMRAEAAQHVTNAAQDAAVAIVGRLIGDTVPPEEAEKAVKAVRS